MGKLYLYEWKKLLRQRTFLFFALVLLFGNLFTLFWFEKHKGYYVYFYELKQEWQDYADGDGKVPNAPYYQAIIDEEENYTHSYSGFLKQIPEQAVRLKETANYQDRSTYLYRNLIKTATDYQQLSADGIKAEPSIGVKELSSYNYGIYFQLLFLFVLSYYVISAERRKGLFLLTKGTELGHAPFTAVKLMVMVSVSMLYGGLQECGTFLLLGHFYGYGDITRNIQSVSVFRDCSVPMTVWQAMAILFAARIGIGLFAAFLIFVLVISLRREGAALLIYTALMGVEMFLNAKIGISSFFNMAKCVNVFFAWDMKNLLGTYINLNVFGYPVGKSAVMLAVCVMLACLFSVFALYRFSASCQISSGNLLEDIREKIDRRTAFMWHSISIYLFELRKVFFQQRRGYLFVILLAWCVFGAREAMEPPIYDNPADGEYHRMITQISGPVTEESLNYIAGQRNEINAMYKELRQWKEQSDTDIQSGLLQHEIRMREDGLGMVENQRDSLLGRPGDISGKYWVDEKSYLDVFTDYRYSLAVFFAAAAALVLWMGEIEAADDRKGLYPLLYTTAAGKRQIWKKKKQVCITGMLWCMISMLIPQFLRYFKIDHFQNAGQDMKDFTQLRFGTSVSLGIFLLLLIVSKITLFIVVYVLLLLLVRNARNMAMVVGAGIGMIGLTVLLLWYFRMDLAIVFIRMFSG